MLTNVGQMHNVTKARTSGAMRVAAAFAIPQQQKPQNGAVVHLPHAHPVQTTGPPTQQGTDTGKLRE